MPCEEIEELSNVVCGDDTGGYDEVWAVRREDVSAYAVSATPGLETTIGTITMVSGKKHVYIAAVDETIQVTQVSNKGKLTTTANWTVPGLPSTSNQHWNTISQLLSCNCGISLLFRKRGVMPDESDDSWYTLANDISPTSAGIFGGIEPLKSGESTADSKLVKSEQATTTVSLTRTSSLKGFLRKVSISTANLRLADVI
jgi:hypothetical protein